MDKFDQEFIMELFLDTEHVSTMNRLVVAASDVVNENSENIAHFHDILNIEIVETDNCINEESDFPIHHHKAQETVLQEEDYNDVFKIKKSTVQALINYLEDYVKPDSMVVPLEKKVHVFLYVLTSDFSYKDIGSLFSLHKSSVNYVFHEIAELLCEQKNNFINWPSLEEQHLTRLRVNSTFKFPNCIGFIDACRFHIGPKRKCKDKSDTVLLQAVCDDSLMFMDVHVGTIGKTKKSKVFKESKLSKDLSTIVVYDNHILGDSEYKLSNNLITPFTSDEILTCEEMKFNELQWKARTCIGRAFEIFKTRFRKLNFIDLVNPESISTLLYAACTLHNFVLFHEGVADIKVEAIMCDDGVVIDPTIVKSPIEKRQFLCNYINYIDDT